MQAAISIQLTQHLLLRQQNSATLSDVLCQLIKDGRSQSSLVINFFCFMLFFKACVWTLWNPELDATESRPLKGFLGSFPSILILSLFSSSFEIVSPYLFETVHIWQHCAISSVPVGHLCQAQHVQPRHIVSSASVTSKRKVGKKALKSCHNAHVESACACAGAPAAQHWTTQLLKDSFSA